VVIADGSKLVETLGAYPLPIEVNPFGLGVTAAAVQALVSGFGGGALKLRVTADGEAFQTDGGHLILDAFFGRISNAKAVSDALLNVPGVVQHGLFLGLCGTAYVANKGVVTKLEA